MSQAREWEISYDKYGSPGHGKKGKQLAILLDNDLQEMYRRYEEKTVILLWMKQSRKRP